MIFDTSVWIQFLNGQESSKVELLDYSIRESKAVHICPPIFQEILQGIRDDKQFVTIKVLLQGLDFLHLDPYEVSVKAAQLYRSLRKKGVTINKWTYARSLKFLQNHRLYPSILHQKQSFA